VPKGVSIVLQYASKLTMRRSVIATAAQGNDSDMGDARHALALAKDAWLREIARRPQWRHLEGAGRIDDLPATVKFVELLSGFLWDITRE
jgi:hypothetical protein